MQELARSYFSHHNRGTGLTPGLVFPAPCFSEIGQRGIGDQYYESRYFTLAGEKDVAMGNVRDLVAFLLCTWPRYFQPTLQAYKYFYVAPFLPSCLLQLQTACYFASLASRHAFFMGLVFSSRVSFVHFLLQ